MSVKSIPFLLIYFQFEFYVCNYCRRADTGHVRGNEHAVFYNRRCQRYFAVKRYVL